MVLRPLRRRQIRRPGLPRPVALPLRRLRAHRPTSGKNARPVECAAISSSESRPSTGHVSLPRTAVAARRRARLFKFYDVGGAGWRSIASTSTLWPSRSRSWTWRGSKCRLTFYPANALNGSGVYPAKQGTERFAAIPPTLELLARRRNGFATGRRFATMPNPKPSGVFIGTERSHVEDAA